MPELNGLLFPPKIVKLAHVIQPITWMDEG
jgi:hypothetical protein